MNPLTTDDNDIYVSSKTTDRRVRKEMGSQVLGSWNKEARADSSLYRVRGAAVVAAANCVARVPSAQCSYIPCLYSWVCALGIYILRCV